MTMGRASIPVGLPLLVSRCASGQVRLLTVDDELEVDEAVAEWEREQQQKHDGTGGRGANGDITKALEESRKQDLLRNAV